MKSKLVALKLFLDELGIPFSIKAVSDRKLIQKSVYLGQLAGVDMGYRYGWYLMGPYSTGLTRDYYDLQEAIVVGQRDYEDMELQSSVREKLGRVLQLFNVPPALEGHLQKDDWLELLSSVHYLHKIRGKNSQEAHATLERQKPHLADHYEDAERVLQSSELL